MTSSAFRPKRGRPTVDQTAAIETTILDTARRLFLAHGFADVSMERVARAAGVSKGTLYARYPTKSDLFQAFARSSMALWASRPVRRDERMTADIRGRLLFHAYSLAASLAEPEVVSFRALILASHAKFPELTRVVYDAGYRYIVGLIVRDLEDEATRSATPNRDPNRVAESLVAMITGWFAQESAIRTVPLDEINGCADRSVDLILAARSAW